MCNVGVQVNCVGSHYSSGMLVSKIKVTGATNIWAIAASGPTEMVVRRNLVKAHCRRRSEYLTLDEDLLAKIRENQVFANKPPQIQAAVKQLVSAAYNACEPKAFHINSDNRDVHEAMRVANPDWRNLFKNLVWRARQQSAIWDVFTHLVERGFIDVSCLVKPINHDTASVDVSEVSAIVMSLETLKDCLDGDADFPEYWCSGFPSAWLSIMIVRGGCDVPEKMSSIIEYSGVFGDFDAECFPTHPYYNCDPDAWLPRVSERRSIW